MEKILVCLSSSPSNGHVIESANFIAKSCGGRLTAIFVENSSHYSASPLNKSRLEKNIRLASELGAEIRTVSGENIPLAIAEYARINRFTKVVLGQTTAPRRSIAKRSTLSDGIVERLGESVEIYIIPTGLPEPREKDPAPSRDMLARKLVITLGALIVATLLGYLFDMLHFSDSTIMMVYLLCVLFVSIMTSDRYMGSFSAIIGAVLFNFLFTDPKLSLRAYADGYPITIGVMLFTAIMVSNLTVRLNNITRHSEAVAKQSQLILTTERLLADAKSENEVWNTAYMQLKKLLNCDLFLVALPAEGKDSYYGDIDGRTVSEDGMKRTAEIQRQLSDGSTQIEKDGFVYIPARASDSILGVAAISTARQILPFENEIVTSILGASALTIRNSRLDRERERAMLMAEKEKTRADMLRLISHDLRTPLTGISGNSYNLIHSSAEMDPADLSRTYQDIYDDAVWLREVMENILSMTRIGDTESAPNMNYEDLGDVIRDSLRHRDRHISEHEVSLALPDEAVPVYMDASLVSQLVLNLVNNAIKYTPKGSRIDLRIRQDDDDVILEVADNGPGIAEEEKDKIFEMFYTKGAPTGDSGRSMGLGLALCRTIAGMHGGELTVHDNEPQGALFRVRFPKRKVQTDG
ncbi:MAG: DUF4118 domain-containing protein [Oscillospiraceae bacterium]|nr:DUF4118 domain-containing protein [Oscillospiraceae bacterium]